MNDFKSYSFMPIDGEYTTIRKYNCELKNDHHTEI
jgi:hypothetical protein